MHTTCWLRLRPPIGLRAYALLPQAQKSAPQKVLDLRQHDVSEALQTHDARISSANTRALVHRFLQAVHAKDIEKSVRVLKRFRKSDVADDLYSSCFITLLNHMLALPMRMVQLKEMLSEFERMNGTPGKTAKKRESGPDSANCGEIRNLVVVTVLKALASLNGTREKLSALNLIGYLQDLQKKGLVDTDGVVAELRKRQLGLVSEFNTVFDKVESLCAGPQLEQFYLQSVLRRVRGDSESLDYTGLCEFVAGATAQDFAGFRKMALESDMQDLPEVFRLHIAKGRPDCRELSNGAESGGENPGLQEHLPQKVSEPGLGNEKMAKSQDQIDEDVDAESEFLYQKQLLIEKYSHSVHKNVSSLRQLFQFEALHREWLVSWLKIGVKSVQNDAELADKHPALHTNIPTASVVSLVLSHMLSATLLPQSAQVIHIAMKIKHALRQEERVQGFLTEDDVIGYVCHVIKILVYSLRVPSSAALLGASDSALFEFHYANTQSKYKRYGALKIDPQISDAFRNYRVLFQANSYDFPMVHAPKKWTDPQNGGFLSHRTYMVKSSQPKALNFYFQRAHETGQLLSVYQSLNALSNVAWRVNPYILSVLNRVPNSGLALFKAPLETEQIEMAPLGEKPLSDASALRSWHRKRKRAEQEYHDKVNLSISYNLAKDLANAYKHETFYFPHSVDFRGRVYPITSFLSYQGDDLARGLLIFGEGKKLGKDGYRWLQYQLANLHSKNKMTMQEALKFVSEHREVITQSAQSPLSSSWWRHGECPWQCLALCHELVSIWAFSGEVSDYISHIPVHQDGSCNGLQHYAALGADIEAAKSVNVLPSPTRQDLYVRVLELVRGRIERDEDPRKKMALRLLSRKLIKQTVMTSVYGVTHYGATRQIERQIQNQRDVQDGGNEREYGANGDLEDLETGGDSNGGELGFGADAESEQIEKESFRLASYIALHVLGSITDLFSGAKKIQSWLMDNCHRCIQAFEKGDFETLGNVDFFARRRFRPMMWTSLSGFPVIQLYRRRQTRAVSTSLQKITLRDERKEAPIDEMKSRNGIAPNFIHSIDAIHLKMTCLAARERNITFAAVHDSFWTHAADVGELSEILRQEFVRLHSLEIIENLRKDMAHVNRESYQLVWVDRKYGEFCEELEKRRRSYGREGEETERKEGARIHEENGKGKFGAWNAALKVELMDNLHTQALLAKHRPSLSLPVPGKRLAVSYSENLPCRKVLSVTHVPIVVPVEVLDAPRVGAMDIQQVLQSPYFFS